MPCPSQGKRPEEQVELNEARLPSIQGRGSAISGSPVALSTITGLVWAPSRHPRTPIRHHSSPFRRAEAAFDDRVQRDAELRAKRSAQEAGLATMSQSIQFAQSLLAEQQRLGVTGKKAKRNLAIVAEVAHVGTAASSSGVRVQGMQDMRPAEQEEE